jgi:hypothetical protein
MPGFAAPVGFGLGRGHGGGYGLAWRRGCGGRGFRAAYPVDASVVQAPDSSQLKGQIDALERTLDILKQQLEAMEKGSGE